MRRFLKWLAGGALVVGILAAGFVFVVLPGLFESMVNRVEAPGPYNPGAESKALHETLLIADLHADSLLFGRDLLKRSDIGHVDIPRLVEGNVALQVFSVVTKSPRGLNIERNDDDTDNITLVALALRWPFETWTSLRARALHQAARLTAYAAQSDNQLSIVRTRGDLHRFLQRRASERDIVAGVLALEGAHVLEGRLENVDTMFAAGYRMMSLAHFFDSEVAGSAHGVEKGGLTELGAQVVRRMEELGMIVDLAHAAPAQIDDVLAIATRPVVVSHTGVRGTCDNARNLSDEQLRGIAATGGIVGIGFWSTATCGTDAASIARAIRHAATVIGAEHVALGSDYDGTVTVPFDASGMALITDALVAEDFSPTEIAGIMGGNAFALLASGLPH